MTNKSKKDYVVITNTHPGHWGIGESVDEALANCKRQGPHSGGFFVHEINPFYNEVHVNRMWGNVEAIVADFESAPADRDDWPPLITRSWNRGARGKMTLVEGSE